MFQALKKGGYLIFSMREKYYEVLGHKNHLEKMEENNKIKFMFTCSEIRTTIKNV
jgi:biotin operon repressor